MCRVLYKISGFLFAIAMAAVAMSYGCKHTNFGPLDPTYVEKRWENNPGRESVFRNPTVEYFDVHIIVIIFPIQMQPSTVEISITDESGDEFLQFVKDWSYDRNKLYLKGPFLFCENYNIAIAPGAEDIGAVTLKEELVFAVQTGQNPFDMDRSSSCKADVVISPVFTDGPDAALFAGDSVSRMTPEKLFRIADVDKHNIFYVDYSQDFDGAGQMIMVPSMYRDDLPGMAKLFVDDVPTLNHYSLDLWAEYEPVSELPASTILHDLQGNPPRELFGPYDLGDLNGDGFNDIVVSSEISIGEQILQEIFILPGPVAYGDNLYLTDVAGNGIILGDTGEVRSRLFAVSDVNGDGKDDVASIRHFGSSYGNPVEYDVQILYGGENLDAVLTSEAESISARAGKIVVDVEGGDVDGDGYSDIMIAELEKKYVGGSYKFVNPQVSLFFGGKTLDGGNTILPDTKFLFRTSQETNVTMRIVGDIDGDGIGDFGIHVLEKDTNGRTTSSKIYIFVGREIWYEQYNVYSTIIPKANVVIDATDAEDVNWKEVSRIGDVNNDGYYDFMITSDDGVERAAHFFLGDPSYGVWRGLNIPISDSDIKWIFR